MDIQPTNQQPISDDQELAKVLAGVNQQDDTAAPAEETAVAAEPEPTQQLDTTQAEPEAPAATEEPAPADYPQPVEPVEAAPAPAPLSGDLESVKSAALSELRPLMDKLDSSPEDKFSTYLLLLRSTDDKDLIAPAHEAAKNIADESERAKALLDIIKEIDYLSNPTGQADQAAAPAPVAEAPATNYYQ